MQYRFTPSAYVMNDIIINYNTIFMEYETHSKIVYDYYTTLPSQKSYYKRDLCSKVLTFYEFYFPDLSWKFIEREKTSTNVGIKNMILFYSFQNLISLHLMLTK